MKCKRLNEVIELLQPAPGKKSQTLTCCNFCRNWRKSQGFDGELADLTDDILILSPENA